MYKVFFKESSFLFTDNNALLKNTPDVYAYTDLFQLKKDVYELLSRGKVFHAQFYASNASELFFNFRSLFPSVETAGGAVIQNGRLLVMERMEKIDLPKGHVEKGEKIEEAAIREVGEECGIQGVEIISDLPATWHMYPQQGVWFLKKTHWFRMTCPEGQVLVPQTEEGIEKVYWLPLGEIPHMLTKTYASLREIFTLLQE